MVEIDPGARGADRVRPCIGAASRAGGAPVYGVTTGLGSRVVERVDGADAATVLAADPARASDAVGEPLPHRV